MKLLAFLLLAAGLASAESFPVIHVKTAWFDGSGTVEITDQGIDFQAKDAKRSRSWGWNDIQSFDRISETEFEVLTYEDSKRYLGRDRSWRFTITDGVLDDGLFTMIAEHLGRPVTNRVVDQPDGVLYEVPVKHLHTFGGCEGTLQFTAEGIYYKTDDAKDARQWLLARDIESVWSSDRYRLTIYAYENNRREFRRIRAFKFDLKAPLDQAFYRELKLKMYHLESAHLPLSSSAGGE